MRLDTPTRREILAGAAAVTGMILAGCENDTTKDSESSGVTFDLDDYPALQQEGGVAKITNPELNDGRPLVVLRRGLDVFSAYSAICTHAGCEVDLPESASSDIPCPCHQSVFSPGDGSVKSGPAQAPLPTFSVKYEPKNGSFTIS